MRKEHDRLARDLGRFGLIGTGPAMDRVFHDIECYAPGKHPVLITGPSGSGKERVAEAIHEVSKRKGKLIRVNAATLDRQLGQARLHGSVRGAYTGADRDREGYLQAAAGGTLFLDEIGDLPLEVQPDLLRVVAEGEASRVGDPCAEPVDVRIVAATDRDLGTLVSENRFRRELLDRLTTYLIRMPSLREHLHDLPDLIRQFTREETKGKDIPWRAEAIRAVVEADPPSARMVQAWVARALRRMKDAGAVGPEHLDLAWPYEIGFQPDTGPLTEKEATDRLRTETLRRHGGNCARAARELGVHPRTLRRYRKDQESDHNSPAK